MTKGRDSLLDIPCEMFSGLRRSSTVGLASRPRTALVLIQLTIWKPR